MANPDGADLCGNIALVGFEILDETELNSIKKIVGGYIKKLCEHGQYKEMKLTLHQHPHGKSFKHEVQGIAFINNKRFAADTTERNLFSAVSQVCDKILTEVTRK